MTDYLSEWGKKKRLVKQVSAERERSATNPETSSRGQREKKKDDPAFSLG